MSDWTRLTMKNLSLEIPAEFTHQIYDDTRLVLRDPSASVLVEFQLFNIHSATKPQAGSGQTGNGLPTPQQVRATLKCWNKKLNAARMMETPREVPGANHLTYTAQGEQRLGTLADLLQRIRFGRSATSWRFWAVCAEESTLLVAAHGPRMAMDFFQKTLVTVLRSVKLGSASQLKKPFIQAVVELARQKLPADSLAVVDNETLSVGGMRIKVSPLHQAYMERPEGLEENVRQFFDDLLVENSADPSSTEGWQAVRDSVFPVLIPAALADAMPCGIVREEWVNQLIIGYQLRNQSELITHENCATWGINQETLHNHALSNLVRQTRELSMTGGNSGNYSLFSFPRDEAMNSARLLLPLVQRHLRPHLGATFYMAAPDRDSLLAFSAQDDATLQWLRHQVELRFAAAAHPLSDKLFMVTPDGIVGDYAKAKPETDSGE